MIWTSLQQGKKMWSIQFMARFVCVCGGGGACIVHLCVYYLSHNCVAAIRCSYLWQDRRSSMCPLRKASFFSPLDCDFTEAMPLMGLILLTRQLETKSVNGRHW